MDFKTAYRSVVGKIS